MYKPSQLQLAGTMALRAREKSPATKIRERKGFVTATVVPDCFEMRNRTAYDNMHNFNLKTKKYEKKNLEYVQPLPHEYRDLMEIEQGMTDFHLRTHPDPVENPHFLSVFQDKPKYQTDKEKADKEKAERERKLAEANKPHDFVKY